MSQATICHFLVNCLSQSLDILKCWSRNQGRGVSTSSMFFIHMKCRSSILLKSYRPLSEFGGANLICKLRQIKFNKTLSVCQEWGQNKLIIIIMTLIRCQVISNWPNWVHHIYYSKMDRELLHERAYGLTVQRPYPRRRESILPFADIRTKTAPSPRLF